MGTTDLKRKYNMSDMDLHSFISKLCMHLSNDLSDFGQFGVTQSTIDNLKSLALNFSQIYQDFDCVAVISVAIESLEKIKSSVINEINAMIVRVSLKWGSESNQNNRLGVGSVVNISDGDLLLLSRSIHSKMSEYLPELADQGLTQEILDNYRDLNDSLEAAMIHKADLVANRNVTTAERITKGNELFSLAAIYCDMGKRLYQFTDRYRYNNYLIYQGRRDPYPKIPENLIYDAANHQVKWSETQDSTSYQLAARQNIENAKWKTIQKGVTNIAEFIAAPGVWLFKARARNDRGYGKWSNEISVKIE